MAAVILDADGRFERMAATDEIGVVAINGPNVFSGYLDPRHNDGLWIKIEGERWLNTGDLGRRDANGYFWLAGRKKELIIRGGHNIDPKIIEDALQKHPAVAVVAAIGSPDAYAGELPVAYVQLKPGAAVTEAELIAHAARTIPEKAAVPKRVKISSSLPTTAVGKLFKPALIQREIEETIRAEAKRVGAEITSMRIERDPHSGISRRVLGVANASSDPGSPRPLCLQVRSDRRARLQMRCPRRTTADDCKLEIVRMKIDRSARGTDKRPQLVFVAMCLLFVRRRRLSREVPRRSPGADEIEVAVEAASVNPIDVRRADGYGRRLLSLVGASRFPMTLGNDFAGTVVAAGKPRAAFALGDRVYGLKPTSRDGSHASHLIVKAPMRGKRPEPKHPGSGSAAVLLRDDVASRRKRLATLARMHGEETVLVHGAAGGFGIVGLQTLSAWGARVTAIAKATVFPAASPPARSKRSIAIEILSPTLEARSTPRLTSPHGTTS